jgi:uncharacterized membrane protein YfcA
MTITHSSFQSFYLWLPLIGFLVGLLGSVLGGGGGFFYMPALMLLFSIPAPVAVATSLAATLPICAVGSLAHYKNGNMDLRTGLLFGVTGIAGAVSGAGLTSLMTSRMLRISFGIYSILIGIQMVAAHRKEKRNNLCDNNGTSGFQKLAKGTVYGFLAGIVTGTFGTSGTAPVVAGLFSLRIPIMQVIGTSLLIVLSNTAFALGSHFILGEIDLTLVYFLTAGSILGAVAGPFLLSGIKIEKAEGTIRKWYALGMVGFGILMILVR